MRRRLISRTGVTVQKCEPGPYTSPGRMMVHGNLAARVGREHGLLAATFVSTYGTPVVRSGIALVDAVGVVEPERHDRGEVHEALRAAARRGVERVPGAEHVHAPECPRRVRPMPTTAAVWITQLGAGGRVLPRARRGQVAGHHPGRGIGAHVHAAHLRARLAVALREPRARSGRGRR